MLTCRREDYGALGENRKKKAFACLLDVVRNGAATRLAPYFYSRAGRHWRNFHYAAGFFPKATK